MARWIDDIQGHGKSWESLLELLRRNHLPHGLAFVGPTGIGKRKVALALAQAGVCAKVEQAPCGTCAPCVRMRNLQSEALLQIAPTNGTLKLEQAQEILLFLSLRSLSRRRFVIVDEASTMNATFANSLLKILEEPPADTHFIFITHALSQLLPTLRSRLQAVRFFPLSEQILASKSLAESWAITAAQGSFSQLEEWTNPQVAEMKERVTLALASLARGQRGAFETLTADIKDKESALLTVRFFQQFFRDAIYMREGIEGVIHADAGVALEPWRAHSKEAIMEFWRDSFQLEQDIGAHLDRPLLFENFYQKVRQLVEAQNAGMV